MQHSRSGEKYTRARLVQHSTVEGFDVFELKHVPLHKRVLNLLICPIDKEFIV